MDGRGGDWSISFFLLRILSLEAATELIKNSWRRRGKRGEGEKEKSIFFVSKRGSMTPLYTHYRITERRQEGEAMRDKRRTNFLWLFPHLPEEKEVKQKSTLSDVVCRISSFIPRGRRPLKSRTKKETKAGRGSVPARAPFKHCFLFPFHPIKTWGEGRGGKEKGIGCTHAATAQAGRRAPPFSVCNNQ